jgi:predicted RNA binding protein YcfA (HicA-like mRNA interferase family)
MKIYSLDQAYEDLLKSNGVAPHFQKNTPVTEKDIKSKGYKFERQLGVHSNSYKHPEGHKLSTSTNSDGTAKSVINNVMKIPGAKRAPRSRSFRQTSIYD